MADRGMKKKAFRELYIAFFLILISVTIGGFFIFFQKPNPFPQKEVNPVEVEFLPATIAEVPLNPTTTDATTTTTDIGIKNSRSTFLAPKILRSIYLTGWSAATPKSVDYAINIADETDINAVVIDIKDWSGYINYDTQVPEAEEYNAERVILPNIETLIDKFHKRGIYVIARITIFQDPILAQAKPNLAIYQESDNSLLWLDKSGLAWIDPASKEAWEYNVAIAKDALNRGFDELNFDYIRFPSDGDLKNMGFPFWDEIKPMSSVIKEFYSYIREELPVATLSVDLFGLSTISSNFGVGHNIEDAYQYFDFVSPMVYPSHYAKGFIGYENPAEYPYEVIKHSMDSALNKLNILNHNQPVKAKLRPWLQDFDLGADYDEEQVRLEIKAVRDSLKDDFSGFMLWNSENIYTREALTQTENNNKTNSSN